MSAIEPFFRLFGLDVSELNKEECIILEAELFLYIYLYLRQQQYDEYKSYFYLLRINKQRENEMLDNNFVSFIMRDVMEKEGYTVEGIAIYTDTSYEIVEQIYTNRYYNPPIHFVYRLITLHRGLRRKIYQAILEKLFKTEM